MKRDGGLFQQICEMDNLRLAYCKARRGKRERPDVMEFERGLESDLREIRGDLLAGVYVPGRYRTFTIYEPKERLISVAPFRDRVLHHAIINVCEPAFARWQIQHSFACQIGRGTYAALDLAKQYSRRNDWFLKLDVRKYFQSISHDRLKAMLRRLFREPALQLLFERLIDSQEDDAVRGLPIGNLTSQYLANHYLARADHFVKEHLRRQAYLRYMDDMVLWGDSSERMVVLGSRMASFLERELDLKLNPWCLNRVEAGLPLLGHIVRRDNLSLSGSSKRRYRAKLAAAYQRLFSGEWDQDIFALHTQALVAVTEYAGETEYRKEVLRELKIDGIIPQEWSVCSAAAAGTTTPGTAAVRTATGTGPATGTGTTGSACAVPPPQLSEAAGVPVTEPDDACKRPVTGV